MNYTSLNRCRSILSICAVVLLLGVDSTKLAYATTINVDSSATGGLGSPNTGWSDMVLGWTFGGGGERVEVTATGTVTLPNTTGPDGITWPIDGGAIGTNDFFPLEEAPVEAGSLVLPRSVGTPIDLIGALMAAFVPETLYGSTSFFSRDEDLVSPGENGIASAALFFVGTGPLIFEASEAGCLYFGINDTYSANNHGQFTATINAVPVPSTLFLFCGGIFALLGLQLQRKKVPSIKPVA